MRIQLAFITACLVAACGNGATGSSEDTTREPSAEGLSTFPLTEGSEIAFAGSPSEVVIRESLSGTMEVHRRLVPNSFFHFEIRRVELRSESFTVAGSAGVLTANTQAELPLWMEATVLINGAETALHGVGGTDTYILGGRALKLTGVQVSGSGYSLTIFTEEVIFRQPQS